MPKKTWCETPKKTKKTPNKIPRLRAKLSSPRHKKYSLPIPPMSQEHIVAVPLEEHTPERTELGLASGALPARERRGFRGRHRAWTCSGPAKDLRQRRAQHRPSVPVGTAQFKLVRAHLTRAARGGSLPQRRRWSGKYKQFTVSKNLPGAQLGSSCFIFFGCSIRILTQNPCDFHFKRLDRCAFHFKAMPLIKPAPRGPGIM